MSFSLSFAIYFICWWITLFAILPLKIGPQPKQGTKDTFAEASGAPIAPNLTIKFAITTVVSTLVFAVVYVLVAYRVIPLDLIPLSR